MPINEKKTAQLGDETVAVSILENTIRCWLGAVASKSKTMSWDLICEKRKRKGWNVKFPIDRERTNLIIRERGLEDWNGGFARN